MFLQTLFLPFSHVVAVSAAVSNPVAPNIKLPKKAVSVESSTEVPNSANEVAGSQFLQRALVEEMKQGSTSYEAQGNSRHLSLGIRVWGMLKFLERVGFICTVTEGTWWMHTDKYTRTAEWLNETVGPIVKDLATGIGCDRT